VAIGIDIVDVDVLAKPVALFAVFETSVRNPRKTLCPE